MDLGAGRHSIRLQPANNLVFNNSQWPSTRSQHLVVVMRSALESESAVPEITDIRMLVEDMGGTERTSSYS